MKFISLIFKLVDFLFKKITYNYISNTIFRLWYSVICIFRYIWFLIYDFFNLSFSKLSLKRSNEIKNNNIIYKNYSFFILKKFFFKKFFESDFIYVDLFFSKILSFKYFFKNLKYFRSNFRILSKKNGFYFNFFKNKFFLYKYYINIFNIGFTFFWKSLRYWLIFLFLFLLILYCTIFFKLLPFNKILFSWISIIMFVYWLISGFVFFIKKYQFGKYTTAIQRFWRRSYILFWLIEAGTFSVFLFLTINSSQEAFYMFDQISVFKTHLYSWKLFFLKIFPITLIIIFTYLLLVSLKWNVYNKYSLLLLFITFLLTYVVWIEFYQFYHVLNFYGNLNWVYDIDDHSWSLEQEPRRTRIINHYIMLLFVLKFWHIVFIYGFWIFFLLRSLEINRLRYPLLSANFQNFLILYIFSWVFMYPWFKFFFKKFLNNSYYWFYINNRKLFFRVFFYDIKLFWYAIVDKIVNNKFNIFNKKNYDLFKYNMFIYWKLLENNNDFEMYRKNVIKDRIIKYLYNIK